VVEAGEGLGGCALSLKLAMVEVVWLSCWRG
jgi:hypothetical protein